MIKRIIVVAHPRSKFPRVEIRENILHIFVSEPAREGKATEAVRLCLAEHLGVQARRVRLLKGNTVRLKVFVCE